MGVFKMFSSCRYREPDTQPILETNPNPSNWIIEKYVQEKKCLIVKIKYPNCTNYEGNKILVYEGITISALRAQKKIDPHFSEDKEFKSPIARFEPTDYGWDLANKFMKSLIGD